MKNRIIESIPLPITSQMGFAEIQEQKYQSELDHFLQNNQSYDEQETQVFDEQYFINYRIDIFEKLVIERQETADHAAGLYFDGKELIDGNLITTKMGTVADLRAAKLELEFLKGKKENLEKSQEFEDVSIKQVKELHNNIFVSNSFEVWEHYKEIKQLTFQDRTDLRLLFDLMKNDNLIFKTIDLKHYIDWLNEFFFNGNIDELKKVDLNAKQNIRRTNDYKEYKKVTLR